MVDDRREVDAVIAAQPPIEASLAYETVRRMIFVGPVLLVLFWVLRSTDGLIGAAIGLLIVAGYYLLTGAIMSVAAKLGLAFYYAGALFGFLLRLALISVTMLGIAALFDVDKVALGITVVVAYIALLAWEATAISNDQRLVEREWKP